MLKVINRAINNFLHVFGYNIVATQEIIPVKNIKRNWAERLDIETIIDIGSNRGQFIKKIAKVLPGRKIYAFEPIQSCYKQLQQEVRGLNVEAFNTALSNENGESEINVSNNWDSSSLLPMEELHKKSYPQSTYVATEKIMLRRLDDLFPSLNVNGAFLIKVDVQGYEKNVVEGGVQTFDKASAIIIETAYEPFYTNQWTFDDTYAYFTGRGYKFLGFLEQDFSPKTGIPLFSDSIFVKKELVGKVLTN